MDPIAQRRIRRRPFWWLWPVPVGMLLGSVFFAPYLPDLFFPHRAHFRGAGVGGLMAVPIAIVMRIWSGRKRARPPERLSEPTLQPPTRGDSIDDRLCERG